MTILMAYALMADIWGTCIIAATPVVVLAEFFKSKTEPNMSEYRPDYLFLVRQRRFERSPHYFINFLSYLSYGLKSIKIS